MENEPLDHTTTKKHIQKGDKRTIRGWVMYDWANSVYNLVISSAIFPIFYDTVTTNHYKSTHGIAETDSIPDGVNVTVNFFGWEVSNSALMSFVLSASFLLVSFLSPLLSGIADYRGNKKRFLQFFCYLGATACISLFYFNDLLENDLIEVGLLSLFIASIGFWNSLVFYNSYLPEIAEPKDHDKISARGFSMGYFGSMLLLVICLLLIKIPALTFGYFDDYAKVTPDVIEAMPVKYCFILVGIWWIAFSQLTYRVLPNTTSNRVKEKGYIWKGFSELKKVFFEFRKTFRLKRYLTAFFFFNTGVQTVMLMATYFAKKEIDWPIDPRFDHRHFVDSIAGSRRGVYHVARVSTHRQHQNIGYFDCDLDWCLRWCISDSHTGGVLRVGLYRWTRNGRCTSHGPINLFEILA
jgi:MFS transporter, UMF1 family